MALLSPFRSSSESFFPESLKQRLKSFGLLDDIGDVALRRLLAEADWFGLPGGTQLARDGEHDRAVFLVVTGSLGVFVSEEREALRLAAIAALGELSRGREVVTALREVAQSRWGTSEGTRAAAAAAAEQVATRVSGGAA